MTWKLGIAGQLGFRKGAWQSVHPSWTKKTIQTKAQKQKIVSSTKQEIVSTQLYESTWDRRAVGDKNRRVE